MRIKLLRPVDYTFFLKSTQLNTSLLPPYNMAIICSYLRKRGIAIEQDDLNIRFYHEAYFKNDNINLDALYNKDLVLSYLCGKSVKKIDTLMKEVFKKTGFLGYDLVLFSSVGYNRELFKENFLLCACRYIKNHNKCLIGVGGMELNSMKLFRKFRLMDLLFLGAGEESLYHVIKKLKKGLSAEIDHPNVIDLRQNKLKDKKPSIGYQLECPDFDDLPMKLYRWSPHQLFRKKECDMLLLPYSSSIGCPYNCAFCTESMRKLKVKPVDEVIADLEFLSKKYDSRHFFFMDNTFNISLNRAKNLCAKMKDKLDIGWSASVTFTNIDVDCLRLMKEAGCRRLIFGFDSGSKKVLDIIGKECDLRHAERMLKYASRIGLWVCLDMITGYPFENEEDFIKTLWFLDRNSKNINSICAADFMLLKESLVEKYPHRYNVKNIKAHKRDNFDWYRPDSHVLEYEERDGAGWDMVQKKKTSRLRRLNKAAAEHGIVIYEKPVEFEFLQYIFLMYNSRKDFSKIKKLMRKIYIYNAFKTTVDPSLFIKSIVFRLRKGQ